MNSAAEKTVFYKIDKIAIFLLTTLLIERKRVQAFLGLHSLLTI